VAGGDVDRRVIVGLLRQERRGGEKEEDRH